MKEKNKIVIVKKYDSFTEFYKENEKKINDELIQCYNKLITNGVDETTLNVIASVCDTEFETNFIINKNDQSKINYLIDHYLPYYISIQDYSKCDEIKKLYEALKN